MKKPYFPLFVDLSEKRILVVGAGKIATRRVESLLDFAGSITVAAPEATERIRQLSREKKICWINGIYHKDMTEEADFVLAATDDDVCNTRIVKDCKARNIPVNACHKKELCDFYFPAVVIKDSVTVGITSGGQSHMQVKKMREQIEAALSKSDTEL